VRRLAVTVDPDSSCTRLNRRRAYELYVQRGSQSGSELDDWLQAEGNSPSRRRSPRRRLTTRLRASKPDPRPHPGGLFLGCRFPAALQLVYTAYQWRVVSSVIKTLIFTVLVPVQSRW